MNMWDRDEIFTVAFGITSAVMIVGGLVGLIIWGVVRLLGGAS